MLTIMKTTTGIQLSCSELGASKIIMHGKQNPISMHFSIFKTSFHKLFYLHFGFMMFKR